MADTAEWEEISDEVSSLDDWLSPGFPEQRCQQEVRAGMGGMLCLNLGHKLGTGI